MKRIFALFALSVVLCAGIAILCTACAPKETESSGVESSATLTPESKPEATSITVASAEPQDTLADPDLQGIVQEIVDDGFTLTPVQVESSGGAAAAGAGGDASVDVDWTHATIETMHVYNGGHGEPQAADAAVIQQSKQVYLYGTQDSESFVADKILVLEIEDEGA